MTATERVDRFKTELAGVQQVGGRGRLLLVGQLLFLAGIVLAVVALIGSSYADDSRDQRDYLILTLLGLMFCIGGAALYIRHSLTEFLRFWLARVIYEQQSATQAAVQPPPTGSDPDTANGADQ